MSVWATKVVAVIKSGNTAAALAQIKVAPTVKDLNALRKQLAALGGSANHAAVDTAISDQITALSSPRLHRSP